MKPTSDSDFVMTAREHPIVAHILVAIFSLVMGLCAGIIAWDRATAVIVFILFYLDGARDIRDHRQNAKRPVTILKADGPVRTERLP